MILQKPKTKRNRPDNADFLHPTLAEMYGNGMPLGSTGRPFSAHPVSDTYYESESKTTYNELLILL